VPDSTFWEYPYSRYNLADVPGGRSIQSVTINTSKHLNFSSGGRYYIYVSASDVSDLDWAWPMVRVWYGGVMQAIYDYGDYNCSGSNNWWMVDWVTGITGFHNAGYCGRGNYPANGGVWPWN
jgi:hypothetical protein